MVPLSMHRKNNKYLLIRVKWELKRVWCTVLGDRELCRGLG